MKSHSKKVLIVGAGAIGSVYGHYAYQSGYEVHFFVKPENKNDLSDGIHLHQWKFFQKKPFSTHWSQFQVHSSTDTLPEVTWDLVVLTFPSDAIDSVWLNNFFSKLTTLYILGLQPSTSDRLKLISAQAFPEEKLTMGTIPIISYKTPMPGDRNPLQLPAGFAFILPPGSVMILDGSGARFISTIFTPGGLKCKKGSTHDLAVAATLLTTLVRTLEMQEWSIDRFVGSDAPVLASQAASQIIQVINHTQKLSFAQKLGAKILLSPALIRMIFRLLPKILPFDIETYLKIHFTKVGVQQQNAINEFASDALKFKLPSDQISRLLK